MDDAHDQEFFGGVRPDYHERREYSVFSPARLDQILNVEGTVDTEGASLPFAHVVRERTSGRIVVEGTATLMATDLSG